MFLLLWGVALKNNIVSPTEVRNKMFQRTLDNLKSEV